jgi:hypothetical protein
MFIYQQARIPFGVPVSCDLVLRNKPKMDKECAEVVS